MQKALLYAGFVVVQLVRPEPGWRSKRQLSIKSFICMRLTLLLIAACLFASTTSNAQRINLSVKNEKLETVFKEIEKQTSYHFIYTKEQLANTDNVSINIKDASINDVLSACFREQPLVYSIQEKYIIVKRKEDKKPTISAEARIISGRITDESGNGIASATITVKNASIATASNERGEWKFEWEGGASTFIISCVGYKTKEVAIDERKFYNIILEQSIGMLDETIVIAYGTTTRRLNTGNVSKVKKEEIERQPVSNPLLALHGRVPGLVVEQTSGLPGADVKLLIRGQSSFRSGTGPLYIIDGVPFMTNTGTLAQVGDPLAQNPFNSINPADIESIEVLKDADATAIYGSQAANGVILITTKKGTAGKLSINVNSYAGFGKITRAVKVLDTKEYLMMRKEGFANDNISPTIANAPDLMVWDSNASTDWVEKLIGGTARVANTQLSISGGSTNTKFFLSGNYYRGNTVFEKNNPDTRASGRINLAHSSDNKRFKLEFSLGYSNSIKRLPFNDLTAYIFLPPNTPATNDSSGNISWTNWVTGVENPMAQFLQEYRSETNTLIAQTTIHYEISQGFAFKTTLGYDHIDLDEERRLPIKALRPSATTTGTLNLGGGKQKNWLIEPQLNYKKVKGQSQLESLMGLSLQDRRQTGERITGSLYTSDDLLRSIASAGQLTAYNFKSQYKYTAIFGRLNYLYKGRYRVNVNMRRDGSSRFGPANRFSNFWAIGGAWIVSQESFLKNVRGISFVKLRSSYGITGNDQIGDYKYLDSWTSSTNYVYQGIGGILPQSLFNKNLQWERNRKFEIGIETGFIENRIIINTAWYKNRSNNLLVFYNLPFQTGYTSIFKNLDALVQNTGIETDVTIELFKQKRFNWNMGFNISFPRNKLIKYPGLELSSDRLVYKIGEPVRIQFGYEFKGVNPTTGVYQFTDLNKDSLINTNDYTTIGVRGVDFFGGLSQDISFANWEVNIFFHFVKQNGRNYLSNLGARPGTLSNQPIYVLDRWQKPGDISSIQRFTTGTSAAYSAYNNYKSSSALITDASFVRLKNISISYNVPINEAEKKVFQKIRVYVQAQNVFTITEYKGSDPETQNLISLPPLRMFTAGIQFTF
jgi:TonB-dependent starch-binding outer membrane protein SusC